MNVPFVDLSIPPDSEEHQQILGVISRIMASGHFVQGPEVEAFENELAAFCGCKQAVGVNSGTDAIFLSLKALGIGKDDEVIVPANVFWAVANAVINAGAIPVFADIDPEDLLLSVKTISPHISPKTKAVIVVHLTGMPCRMKPILELCKVHNLYVIEDAAQAIGATYQGEIAGTMGDLGCFSFHPLKNVGACGDGGAVITNNIELAQKINMMRNHGLADRANQLVVGWNSRLDEIQAAILRIRLRKNSEIVAKKRDIASYYNSELRDVCQVIPEGPDRMGVYQLYVIRHHSRDALAWFLENEMDVHTGIHYRIPSHQQQAMAPFCQGFCLETTQKAAREILSLPIYPQMTDDNMQWVVESIKSFEQ